MQAQPQEISILTDVLLPILLVALPIIGGAIGNYIGYKRGRTSVFREKIYDKQIEGYSELIRATYQINDFFILHDFRYADLSNSKNKMVVHKQIEKLVNDFRSVMAKWVVFFPRGVINMVNEYGDVINAISIALFNDKEIDKLKISQDVVDTQRKLLKSIQVVTGTEKLSAELRQYFGEAIEAGNKKK